MKGIIVQRNQVTLLGLILPLIVAIRYVRPPVKFIAAAKITKFSLSIVRVYNFLVDKLTIRTYKPSDNSVAWELHWMGLKEIGATPVRNQGWDKDFSDIEGIYLKDGEFLVGEMDGKIVAMGAFKKIDEQTAELKRMRVHPDFQRRGFGQQILDELEKRAKEKGFKKMILDTSKKSFKAQNFYTKNGYIETGRNDLDERYNAIFYEKKLI